MNRVGKKAVALSALGCGTYVLVIICTHFLRSPHGYFVSEVQTTPTTGPNWEAMLNSNDLQKELRQRQIKYDKNQNIPAFGILPEFVTNSDLSYSVLQPEVKSNNSITKIAIGGAITSKKLTHLISVASVVAKFYLFQKFLPSFCKTADLGYEYHFYFAYDFNDAFFSVQNKTELFHKAFQKVIASHCPGQLYVSLKLLQCSHAGELLSILLFVVINLPITKFCTV